MQLLKGLQKIKNPAEILMSDWIRPEDVHHYEELADKLGKTNLTLKLTDRARPTCSTDRNAGPGCPPCHVGRRPRAGAGVAGRADRNTSSP